MDGYEWVRVDPCPFINKLMYKPCINSNLHANIPYGSHEEIEERRLGLVMCWQFRLEFIEAIALQTGDSMDLIGNSDLSIVIGSSHCRFDLGL